MATKKVVPKKESRLIEILQNNKTRFAFCRYDSKKDALIQCHTFVQCRDFLLDVLVASQDERKVQVYGFSYGLEDPALDKECTSLLLKMENAGSLKNFQDNLCILEDIENQLGFGYTWVELVEYPNQKEAVIWVVGDPRWQQATSLLSLYTYLLKCLTYQFKDRKAWREEIAGMGTIESQYMDSAHIDFMLENVEAILSRYKTVSGFPKQKELGVHSLHEYCGFKHLEDIISNGDGSHVMSKYKKEEANALQSV